MATEVSVDGVTKTNKAVKSISGHRSDVVDHYKHVSDEQKRKASAILQNRTETVTKPTECEKIEPIKKMKLRMNW